jgi:hypothetical protein
MRSSKQTVSPRSFLCGDEIRAHPRDGKLRDVQSEPWLAGRGARGVVASVTCWGRIEQFRRCSPPFGFARFCNAHYRCAALELSQAAGLSEELPRSISKHIQSPNQRPNRSRRLKISGTDRFATSTICRAYVRNRPSIHAGSCRRWKSCRDNRKRRPRYRQRLPGMRCRKMQRDRCSACQATGSKNRDSRWRFHVQCGNALF